MDEEWIKILAHSGKLELDGGMMARGKLESLGPAEGNTDRRRVTSPSGPGKSSDLGETRYYDAGVRDRRRWRKEPGKLVGILPGPPHTLPHTAGD